MSDWKAEQLTEARAGNKTWKLTKLTAPDGTVLMSVKLYGKKKDGTEYQSKHGITMPLADCTKETFGGLVELLKKMVKNEK